MALVNKYDLDGFDIDWEYPNSPNGDTGNLISSDDSANLLSFLKVARDALGPKKLITLATALTPFNGPDQNPLTVGVIVAPSSRGQVRLMSRLTRTCQRLPTMRITLPSWTTTFSKVRKRKQKNPVTPQHF
jgi:hypothetical protein